MSTPACRGGIFCEEQCPEHRAPPIRHTVAGMWSVTIPADAYDRLVQASGFPSTSTDPDRSALAARQADSSTTPHHAPARGPEGAGTICLDVPRPPREHLGPAALNKGPDFEVVLGVLRYSIDTWAGGLAEVAKENIVSSMRGALSRETALKASAGPLLPISEEAQAMVDRVIAENVPKRGGPKVKLVAREPHVVQSGEDMKADPLDLAEAHIRAVDAEADEIRAKVNNAGALHWARECDRLIATLRDTARTLFDIETSGGHRDIRKEVQTERQRIEELLRGAK